MQGCTRSELETLVHVDVGGDAFDSCSLANDDYDPGVAVLRRSQWSARRQKHSGHF